MVLAGPSTTWNARRERPTSLPEKRRRCEPQRNHPQEYLQESHTRLTEFSSHEYGRHNSCKRSEPWTGCQKMCLERPLSHFQERSLTGRLHKLAAAGDVRAKDSAELATLRQKLVGLWQEAENCLDQNMLMMCNRIRSSALQRRTHRCKRLLDDVALRHLLRSTMFGTQCGSLPPCVHLSLLECCVAGLLW